MSELISHPEYATDVVIVRHGETEWNTQGRLQGWRPVPLNANGQEQVRASAATLASFRPTAIYSSPVLRAVETAEIIADELGLDRASITQHDGLGEFRMGTYEGKAWAELIELDSWKAYLRSPHETTFPGGESLVAIRDRAIGAVNAIVEAHGGGRLVITTHGGIARLTMLTALASPLSAYHRLGMPNAGVSRLRLVPGRAPKVLAVSWSPTPAHAVL